MIAGFLGVPIFSFAVPPLLKAMNQEALAGYLSSLDVLLPAFLIGFTIVVSLLDKKGQTQLEGIEDDMLFAKTGKEI